MHRYTVSTSSLVWFSTGLDFVVVLIPSDAAPLHEREILEAALRESEGMVGGLTGAAVKLGIPRRHSNPK